MAASSSSDTTDSTVLEQLIAHSGILILELDLEARVVWFNDAFAELGGATLDQTRGEDWVDHFVPESNRATTRRLCRGMVGQRRGDSHTKPFIAKDGAIRYVEWFHSDLTDPRGNPRGILCIGRDITELHSARHALEEAEQRSRGVLETAVNAIITMGEDRLIETVNAATVKMFGYSMEEMIGHNVKMLMPEPYRAQHDQYVSNYRTTGSRRIIGIGREAVARRKDGTVFPIDLSVGEVTLNDGRKIFTGIIRDLSDRKELEQRILQISEEEQQRIGQDIHDDLCQQLAAIGCLAQVIHQRLEKSGSPVADDLKEIVSMLSASNLRAREMSRGLMPVVLDSGGLSNALAELARSTERIFRISCSYDIDKALDTLDNQLSIQLYRIAQEAVANAAKHSEASRIQISLRQQGEILFMDIADNGKGIPDHSPASGTGMGLLTMHRRARMMGGDLSLASQAMGGTLVQCQIPIRPSTLPPMTA